MRVWHLGKFYPPAFGGIETHVRALARAQASLGAEVRVLCVNHMNRAGDDVTWRMFPPTATQIERDGRVEVVRLGRLASVARLDLCAGVIGALRRATHEGVDVLHLHVPNPMMLLALSLARPKVPLIITHHSDIVRQRLTKLALEPFERFVYRSAARIICNSPPYLEGSPVLRAHREKVCVIPMGIDQTPFVTPSEKARAFADELRRRFSHAGPIWLSIGRLVYYKGLSAAIEALGTLPGTLLVIGTGPLEVELGRLADERGVRARVIFLGQVDQDELAGAYQAATALMFPSNARSEAFGLVQVEAMASGCPVLNADIEHSGVPWVSRHEESGITVSTDGRQAAFQIAAAGRRLLDEPGLRKRLAAGARARAQAEFDHRVMAERTLALYREVGRSFTERSRE